MKYPQEFIDDVKSVLSDGFDLYRRLELGDSLVGRILDESRHLHLSSEDIVKAFDEGREQEVYNAAKRSSKINALYSRYWDIVDSQRK